MLKRWNRRGFLGCTTTAGALLGFGGPKSFFASLAAAEVKLTPEVVRFGPEIEPLIRLIEDTPRERCVEMLVEQLRRGVSYRQFMSALFLAGLRTFKPSSTGGMHSVYLIHAAHQISLDGATEERLLPLFYALDSFKAYTESPSRQRQLPREGRLLPFRGTITSIDQAWNEFHAAMDAWDAERADRAIVALVRSRGAHEIAEGLWRYGARDFRQNGHKPIFLSNALRTLETIGWQHAEVVFRAVIRHLNANGKARFEEQPYLPNLDRVRKSASKLPGNWAEAEAQSDPGLTKELLALIHNGETAEACELASTRLTEGQARAGSLWDAAHLAAGELIMREHGPWGGLRGVHAVTSTNALHYAFRMSTQDQTRFLLLLQALAWMSEFRNLEAKWSSRGLKNVNITQLSPSEIPDTEEAAAREVLAIASGESGAQGAASKAFRYGQAHPEAEVFLREARRLIVHKSYEEHQYKYPAAIFEDFGLVSPQWRPNMLAAAVYHMHGSSKPDSALIQRAVAALGG
jgi:hypothetical protein